MSLTERQKKQLRRLGHARRAVVIVGGQGLHDRVLVEIDRALRDHELIKVRLAAADRHERQRLIDAICAHAAAEAVQRVGRIVLLYRPHPERPRIVLD